MARKVIYEQSARDDLRSIFRWIAEAADPETAQAYVQRIHERCDSLGIFPERGSARDDIAPALRTVPFERSAMVAYLVEQGTARVLRILRTGRDVNREFSS